MINHQAWLRVRGVSTPRPSYYDAREDLRGGRSRKIRVVEVRQGAAVSPVAIRGGKQTVAFAAFRGSLGVDLPGEVCRAVVLFGVPWPPSFCGLSARRQVELAPWALFGPNKVEGLGVVEHRGCDPPGRRPVPSSRRTTSF